MNIIGQILGKIFNPSTMSTAQATPTSSAVPAAAGLAKVDIEQVLSELAAKKSEKLNWKTSIVDLMKLLGLQSDLSARQQLAKELGYTGNPGDSAAMNVWLLGEVMKKVSENGGKVPSVLH